MNKNMFFLINDYKIINETYRIMKKHNEKDYHLDYKVILKIKKYILEYQESPAYKEALKDRAVYIDMIEKVLKKENLPSDLSFLVFLRSGFNKNYYNKLSLEKGLWALDPQTAKKCGLITQNNDGRNDPKISTEKTVLYLKNIYSIYNLNSFLITAAAFHSGVDPIIYGLNRVKNPKKNLTFWYLYNTNLIPYETEDFIIKLIATMILYDNPDIKIKKINIKE